MTTRGWLICVTAALLSAAPAAAQPGRDATCDAKSPPSLSNRWRADMLVCPPAPARGDIQRLLCLALLGSMAVVGAQASRRKATRVVFS